MRRIPDPETKNPTVEEITNRLHKMTIPKPMTRGSALPLDPTNTLETESLLAPVMGTPLHSRSPCEPTDCLIYYARTKGSKQGYNLSCLQKWSRLCLPTHAPDIRYTVPMNWMGHKDSRICIRLYGTGGKRRKKTLDTNTRNDWRVRKFRNWVDYAFFRRGYKWWLVPTESVILVYLRETHLGGKKSASETCLVVSAIAWWGESLMGTRVGWRNHWHAINVALGINCTTEPARPKKQAPPIVEEYITILGDYLEHVRTEENGGRHLDPPGSGTCHVEWYMKNRTNFDWVFRTTMLCMAGYAGALRAGEYLSSKNNMPYLRNANDGDVETPALMIKDLSVDNEAFLGANLRDQKGGKSRPSGIGWTRCKERKYDFASLLAEWNGFGTVKEMVENAKNLDLDRIPLMGFYKFAKLIPHDAMWYNETKKRRHRLNTLASFNLDLKKLLESAVEWKRGQKLTKKELTFCKSATSHGLRRGFVHTRFRRNILTGIDFKMDALLIRKLRWKSGDLVELYGCHSTNEMMAIFSRID